MHEHSRGSTIRVFTTRPDTLFGATYMVLAPEHPLVDRITTQTHADVEAYRASGRRKSDLDRTDLAKTKTGVFTGAYAINPVNGAADPVWIADYVLMGYGTGAIMAVPGHDERDFEFAQAVRPADRPRGRRRLWSRHEHHCSKAEANHGDRREFAQRMQISLDGLPTAEAKAAITDWLEKAGSARRRSTTSSATGCSHRQRYWGEPFPVVLDAEQTAAYRRR